MHLISNLYNSIAEENFMCQTTHEPFLYVPPDDLFVKLALPIDFSQMIDSTRHFYNLIVDLAVSNH